MPVKEMKVYIASCWWKDNDPFIRIVGNSADVVRRAMNKAMEDAAKVEWDSCSDEQDGAMTVDQYLDQIRWSGVHSMNLTDVMADYEIPETEPDYTNLISGDTEALVYL